MIVNRCTTSYCRPAVSWLCNQQVEPADYCTNILHTTDYIFTYYSSNYVLMYTLFFKLCIDVQIILPTTDYCTSLQTTYCCSHQSSNYRLLYTLVFKLQTIVHRNLRTTHYCTNSNYKIGFSLKSSSTQSKFLVIFSSSCYFQQRKLLLGLCYKLLKYV